MSNLRPVREQGITTFFLLFRFWLSSFGFSRLGKDKGEGSRRRPSMHQQEEDGRSGLFDPVQALP